MPLLTMPALQGVGHIGCIACCCHYAEMMNQADAACQESSNRSRDADVLKAKFEAAVTLHRFKAAWDAALLLKSPQLWQALGQAHLHDLDAESAMR